MLILTARQKNTGRIPKRYRKGNRHPLSDPLENSESHCNFTRMPEGYRKDTGRILEGYRKDTGRIPGGYRKG
jgi:hypothetical protein